MRTLLVTIGALLALAMASGGAGAGYYHSDCWSECWARPYYPRPPASDFSAYYYQSPGGIGRARSRPYVDGYRHHERGLSK
jgi:hypothetical protein